MPNPVSRAVLECFLSVKCLRGEALSVDDVAVIRAYADQMEAALTAANERIKLDAETIKAVIKARDERNSK